jgi:D-sedoheptulose 7-phosphate isomerase
MKREASLYRTASRTAVCAGITNARDYFEIYRRVSTNLPYVELDRIGEELWRAYVEGRKILLFGNGGSASLACHFACDLEKGTVQPATRRRRLEVLSLTSNVALMTALANDYSYEHVFAEQIHTHLNAGDIALAISGSGNSPNVLKALEASRELGGINIGLGGFEGGKMKALCDYCAVVPSDNMQIIEDLQLSMAHALFTCLRERIASHAEIRTKVAEAS